MKLKKLLTVAAFTSSLIMGATQASDLTIPTQFTSGTKAVAADVNGNFDAAAVAVTDNQAQITALLARLTALEQANTEMQAKIDTLEASSVDGLSTVLSVTTDRQGRSAAIFSGTNVHVNNGLDSTATINGLGNLIVGYDEETTFDTSICADGQYDNQTDCEQASEIWAIIHKSGSHNIIIGSGHNYSREGGLIAGLNNTVNGSNSSVTGGKFNIASGTSNSVTGGNSNIASGTYNSVSGGSSNTASGVFSSVSGGLSNISSGLYSSISGGQSNATSGQSSSVSGGASNTASGVASSVSGGSSHSATGADDWVAGSLFEEQ